jgi:hypothetical protein
MDDKISAHAKEELIQVLKVQYRKSGPEGLGFGLLELLTGTKTVS